MHDFGMSRGVGTGAGNLGQLRASFGSGGRENTFASLNTSGLTYDQSSLLKDYMRPFEGVNDYGERAQFMIDFLKNPQDFEPTDFSKKSAFCHYVLHRTDEHRYRRPEEVRLEEIDADRLRNVRVDCAYRYFSMMGTNCTVLILEAETRNDTTSEWKKRDDAGGIAFRLEDFAQRKR